MITWEEFLDELESRIARSRSVAEAGIDEWLESATQPARNPELMPLGHFEPPTDLGDIPPALTKRAQELVEQARVAEAELTQKLDDVWSELSTTPTRRPEPPARQTPVFLDQRA